MDYRIRSTPEATEILLNGRLTFADHETFRAVLAAVDGPAGHGVVLDLAELEFLDSSGLGMVVIARDLAQRKSLAFSVRGARDEIRRMVAVARFQPLFDAG
ncbi:STAS domain-containing protein [Azospirillum sp. ST 5-10]|uniref:STAS domain-containing protein n=1 Tax=unclassified Azospirillum TaxID=2630922 RepID=UPI003F4A19D9